MEAGVHKETKSLSAEGRWAKRSDSRKKMHAGDGKKGEGWRAKRRQNLRRLRRNK
ncbi:MAG: hypothetical protein ACLR23_05220 [Clostridia bacterium]